MKALPLEDLTPDTHTVKHAAGAYARVLSSPGGAYGMYFEASTPFEVTLNLPAGDYSGEWVNTKTGRSHELEKFQHGGGEKILHPPEFQGGLALHLTRKVR